MQKSRNLEFKRNSIDTFNLFKIKEKESLTLKQEKSNTNRSSVISTARTVKRPIIKVDHN